MSKDGGGLNLSCDVDEEVLGDVDEEVAKETPESEEMGHMITGEGDISNVLLKLPLFPISTQAWVTLMKKI